MYLHLKPLEDPKDLKIEIFNELTMQALLYVLVFYTDLTDKEFEFRSDLGLLSIFLILFNFSVHIALLFAHSFFTAKRYLKRKCA